MIANFVIQLILAVTTNIKQIFIKNCLVFHYTAKQHCTKK